MDIEELVRKWRKNNSKCESYKNAAEELKEIIGKISERIDKVREGLEVFDRLGNSSDTSSGIIVSKFENIRIYRRRTLEEVINYYKEKQSELEGYLRNINDNYDKCNKKNEELMDIISEKCGEC